MEVQQLTKAIPNVQYVYVKTVTTSARYGDAFKVLVQFSLEAFPESDATRLTVR